MSDFKELDLNLLNDYMDSLGKDIVEQMLNLYIQQSIEYIDNIGKAVAADSQSLWQESCHKMKGAAASAGLLSVHAKLVTIEKSSEDTAVKSAYINELEALNEQALVVFKSWLNR